MGVEIRREVEEVRFTDFIEQLEELMENPKADYALEMLEGIHTWCSDAEVVTDKQIDAVDKVVEGLSKTRPGF